MAYFMSDFGQKEHLRPHNKMGILLLLADSSSDSSDANLSTLQKWRLWIYGTSVLYYLRGCYEIHARITNFFAPGKSINI